MTFKKTNKKIKLLPKKGDILYVDFPDRENKGLTLQNKVHYCLCIGIINLKNNLKEVMVLYGTSQDTSHVYKNEIKENPSTKNHLLKPTKWRVAPDCVARMPIDGQHMFIKDNTIKCGSANETTMIDVDKLLKSVNFKKTLKLLLTESTMMIDEKYWNDETYYPN